MRVLRGLLSGVMLLLTLGMVGVFHKHLLHPHEARHVSRMAIDGIMFLLFGYFAWAEGRRTFGRSAEANNSIAYGGKNSPLQTVGATLLVSGPDRLTIRPAPKTRLLNIASYTLWLLIAVLAVPRLIHRHAWILFAFNVLLGLFALFMLTFAALRWKDQAVWDKIRGQFVRNGVPILPLEQIVHVEGEKVSGVHHLVLVAADGTRVRATPALTAYRKPEEAALVARHVGDFLALTPTSVWPPPPTVSGD